MRYIQSTIVEHITRQCTPDAGTLHFVLPSYPSRILRGIGEEIEEHLARHPELGARLRYGIAYRLGREWQDSNDAGERADFAVIRERRWYNEGNNLTSLRNEARPADVGCLVSLIAGYEHIDDRASLRDFYRLDQRAIWEICLKRSFLSWVKERLGEHLDPCGNRDEFQRIADLLKTFYEHGLADLLGISLYLEKLNLDGVMTGGEAYQLVLTQLSDFGLPCLAGLSRSRAPATRYIAPAQEFMNYSMFLEPTSRDRAMTAIENFRKDKSDELPEESVLGPFSSLGELIDALERYIIDRSTTDRDRLRQADFVYIHDQILGYRKRGTRMRRTARKLRGLAPEVFLRALWLTLADWKKGADASTAQLAEGLKSIALESVEFKHDFDAGDEAESGYEDRDLAEAFLKKVLGGLDSYLKDQIRLTVDGADGPRDVEMQCRLEPGGEGVSLVYTRTSTAQPTLKFVVVVMAQGEAPYRQEFLWCLPPHHQSRILVHLYNCVREDYQAGRDALPAVGLPFIPETFLARDADEVCRLLSIALQSEDRLVTDLLAAEGMNELEAVYRPLRDLAEAYQRFIHAFHHTGFFAALNSDFDRLQSAYREAYRKHIEHASVSVSGPLLLKAFMVVPKAAAEASDWAWQRQLEGAVVTPLHPAVLDMIRHQHTFLCESFCFCVRQALADPEEHAFSERHWNRVADLAQMQWPIFGTLAADGQTLDTNVRSYGYLHLVGECSGAASLVTSRLLLDDDADDDEEITDTELFRVTRASKLIHQVLGDYRSLHAHASDGISIGAYCGREIQPVVAGIDAFLKDAMNGRDERPYSLQLTIFSDSRDDSSVMRWISSWRDRWQVAECAQGKAHYAHCRISISHRVIAPGADHEPFAKLLSGASFDVMLFTEFITAGRSSFVDLGEGPALADDYRKFPVLERTCCAVRGGGLERQRERVLSNPRFLLGSLHAEVMARLNDHHQPSDCHAVISQSNYQPWETVVDAAHRCSTWVVCIDPSVDEYLLRRTGAGDAHSREIIGFGTGVGPHGENNYTVSTEQFSMADVRRRISDKVLSCLGPWDATTREAIAESLVREASQIAGLSVVKATGPSEYVRDYIAYATIRKLLPPDPNSFCDDLVSVDAYRHWFDETKDAERPDLLRLRARIVDGYIRVDAQIIECKLAQQSEGYLVKARQQIESGLRRLVPCFRPREPGRPTGIDDPPDQRYWWMQLHRLIASRAQTSRPEYQKAIMALERLSEGEFYISWQAAAVGIWTDVADGTLRHRSPWHLNLDGGSIDISVVTAGREFIRAACLTDARGNIFSTEPALRRGPCSSSASISDDADPTSQVGHAEAPGVTGGSVPAETDTSPRSLAGNALGAEPTDVDESEPKASQYDQDVGGMVATVSPAKPMNDCAKQAGDPPMSVDDSGHHGSMIPASSAGTAGIVHAEASAGAGVRGRVPKRILLGQTTSDGRDVYWEFGHPDLPNRHILVFGASGTGKTYTIQALLNELAASGQNSLIVDYTNGFTNPQLDAVTVARLNPTQHVVKREPLPVNPFRRQTSTFDGLEIEESPADTAGRVSGIFSEVYQLGDQQKSALYSAIRDGIQEEGDAFSLSKLMQRLEDLRAVGGPTANSAASVISRIQPFVDTRPFGREAEGSWERLFSDDVSRCHIIQLATFIKDSARLITEFALIDLYWYYRARGSKDQPKVIVLDEIQNLDHRLESPLGQFLTEGRKFGISLILATQTLSNLSKDQSDRLFQASHKLFFRPADTEIRSFSKILETATATHADVWVQRLSSLKRGECFSLGHALNETTGKLETSKYFRIRVSSLESRLGGV
jgi:DNA phosphorothioation-dependent restriction protein DptH